MADMQKKTIASSRHRSPCNCGTLRKATRRISQLYDAALAPTRLKATQLSILAHIGRSEPITVGDLAAQLVMDAGALAHTLKPLSRDGYLSSAADPSDRRARLIRLTKRGRAKLDETTQHWLKAQRAFETAFGARRAQQLRDALSVLTSEDFDKAFEAALTEIEAR